MSTFEEQIDPANALHPENVAHNARALNYIRSTVASISGAVAGILGLTSFYGFGFYFCSSLIAAVVVYVCNVGLTPRKYFKNGFVETATQGLLGNMMSFTLFWTMFYGLVHIFEA